MKKSYLYIILFSYFLGAAQCPAPTNLSVSNSTTTDVQLSWTENGTATQWEVAVDPDYSIGSSIPTTGTPISSVNPFIVTGLSPGCNVFYVRSVCSSTDVSNWSLPIASGGCGVDVYTYINSLSNNVINYDYKEIILYPNPAQKALQLQTKSDTTIDKIIITDLSGKIILEQTQNTTQVNVEQLSVGMYFIEAFSGDEKNTSKFVKE